MRNVSERERGVALLTVIGIIITMFGATASVIMVLSARARAMTDTANDTAAFYLAESGLETGKYELARTMDIAGDGLGNVSETTAGGSYVVVAEDLGGNTWRLTSTGAHAGHETTIEAVVGRSRSTRFPAGAATLVGDFDTSSFKFQAGSNVLIDGGNVPAFSVTSQSFYEALGTDLATDVATGALPPESIVGSQLNPFMPERGSSDPVDLSVQQYESYADDLRDLTGVYDAALSTLYNDVIPAAQTISTDRNLSHDLVYGTADAPATVYLTDQIDILQDGSISGYGTLVIDDTVQLHSGSEINWNGDVFIVGEHADLTVTGGTLDVTGNLMILGSGDLPNSHATVSVQNGGVLNVDGSFLMSTSFGEGENTEATLRVGQGDLQVDGLFTILGRDIDLDFQSGSDVAINGMWQAAAPPGTGSGGSRARLTTNGDLQIVYDQQNLDEGIGELVDLGADFDLPEIDTLVSEELSFYSWQMVATTKE